VGLEKEGGQFGVHGLAKLAQQRAQRDIYFVAVVAENESSVDLPVEMKQAVRRVFRGGREVSGEVGQPLAIEPAAVGLGEDDRFVGAGAHLGQALFEPGPVDRIVQACQHARRLPVDPLHLLVPGPKQLVPGVDSRAGDLLAAGLLARLDTGTPLAVGLVLNFDRSRIQQAVGLGLGRLSQAVRLAVGIGE
jgi:hypothetical protein